MNTLPAVLRFPRRILPTWAADAGLCLAPQHEYAAPFFHSNCLYFCTHCGREMLGRTWDDIEPMTDEQIEMLEYFDTWFPNDERKAA